LEGLYLGKWEGKTDFDFKCWGTWPLAVYLAKNFRPPSQGPSIFQSLMFIEHILIWGYIWRDLSKKVGSNSSSSYDSEV
jgi:hypothetical protein